MEFRLPIRIAHQHALSCAAGMLFLLAAGCIGHDELRLRDPSPCHMQCQFNSVAQLDPECHGYHPTCWTPWSADCPGCPPPPSGVYPVLGGPAGPEPIPPPQPQLKPAEKKLPAPETKPTPSETTPSEPTPTLETPAKPSESMPAPGETPAPSETPAPAGVTPAPSESMPAPDSKQTSPEATPTVPELPPLVPPGREIPGGPQQKERKHGEKEPNKTSAQLENAAPQSNRCQQAAPLGTITELKEPAKLELAQTQVPQKTAAPACNSSPSRERPGEGENAANAVSSDKPNVVQAIYQVIVPTAPAEQPDAAEQADEAEQTSAAPDETASSDEATDADSEAIADSAVEHGPISRKLGGILIVACSLICGGMYLKSLLQSAAQSTDG